MQEDKFAELEAALLQAKEDFRKREQQRLQEVSEQKETIVTEEILLSEEEKLLVRERVDVELEAEQYKEGYTRSRSQIEAEVVAGVIRERRER